MYRSLEEYCHLVFVDNIPFSITRDWLFHVFSFASEISNIYLRRKKRRPGSTPFAFVRFYHRCDALKATHEVNGKELEGFRSTASEAKFIRL